MSKVKRNCKTCFKEFFARAYQIKIGTGLYCSTICRAKDMNKAIPIEERFWDKVDIKESNDCWEFKGNRNKDGYGIIGIIPGKNEGTHRVAYRLVNGDFDKNLKVCHKCDNPSCCNPNHLFLGTQDDNIQDMITKGRYVPIKKGYDSKRNIFTEEEVNNIRANFTNKRGERIALARKYNVAPTTITNIIERKGSYV